MKVFDFSPHHENTTGNPERVALDAHTPQQYSRALAFFKCYFSASFPNPETMPEPSFQTAKKYYHGNAKIFLSCAYNDIIGKYEITVTTRGLMKKCAGYYPYNFIGTLTDYTNNL